MTPDPRCSAERTVVSSDIAFTPTVKEIQRRKGSRKNYARMEQNGAWRTLVTDDLAAFAATQTSVFLATANANGQPYIQHRGGPPGFLRAIDQHTLAFADFVGNRQYITQGNLVDNPKACLFLIDYERRQRVKIWGRAKIVEGDAELMSRLMPRPYEARAEQVLLFSIDAWDINCPQHIPVRLEHAKVASMLAKRDARIAELEAIVARLSARPSSSSSGMEF